MAKKINKPVETGIKGDPKQFKEVYTPYGKAKVIKYDDTEGRYTVEFADKTQAKFSIKEVEGVK